MGAGNTVDDSEASMIQANRGERASMWRFTNDVGSGSSSHDFGADDSAISSKSESDAGSNTSKRAFATVGVSSAGSGYRLRHSASLFFETSLEPGSECDSSATSGGALFTFRPRSESPIL